MAQIDSSIYFRQQTPDIIGSVQRGLSMREMLDTQKRQAKERANQASIKRAYSEGITQDDQGNYNVDRNLTLSNLAKGKHPQEFLRTQSAYAKQDADAEKNEMDKTLKKINLADKMLGSIYDQSTYTKALNEDSKFGLGIFDGLPKEYDADLMKSAKIKNMDIKDRLSYELSQRKLTQDAAHKQKVLGLKRKELEIKKQKGLNKQTVFGEKRQKESAKAYVKDQSRRDGVNTMLSDVNRAIKAQIEYTKDSLTGGTGPFATLGGLTGKFMTGTSNLNALFKTINLKNMIKTFAGMSKAIDTDGERAAWDGTQADIGNDDEVNLNILLSQRSLLLKEQTELDARRHYVEEVNGNMDRYVSPIIGEVSSMISQKKSKLN